MPAMLDDPTSLPLTRVTGSAPYPLPGQPYLPPSIVPRQVTLRDRVTIATLLPFSSSTQVPGSLLAYLADQLNREIEKGDTYPMVEALSVERFGGYWFQNFGAVMVLEGVEGIEQVGLGRINAGGDLGGEEGVDWSKVCLGSFYVKPNYPGRSSHVCNGGFLVTDAARNKGVGRLMGEGYLEWAPKLGYTYSVFNLVYETNLASCRIWDALGFKRIGRVKGCGALRSHPDTLIDAIIYGRDLGPEGEDFVSEERFDKIRYYLKHGKYPAGADRAEKSRLRSAATHYKLLPAEGANGGSGGEGGGGEGEERLMLKDKEVVADAQRQYEIARAVHAAGHGGINKTTATIAEKYHWVRIKETVSLVIRNCGECKEGGKVPAGGDSGFVGRGGGMGSSGGVGSSGSGRSGSGGRGGAGTRRDDPNERIERLVTFEEAQLDRVPGRRGMSGPSGIAAMATASAMAGPGGLGGQSGTHPRAPVAQMGQFDNMPLDPQIMQDAQFTNTQDAQFSAQGDPGMQGGGVGGMGADAYAMEMAGNDGGAAGMGFAESVRDGRERMQGQAEMEMGQGVGGLRGEGMEGVERQLMEAGFGAGSG